MAWLGVEGKMNRSRKDPSCHLPFLAKSCKLAQRQGGLYLGAFCIPALDMAQVGCEGEHITRSVQKPPFPIPFCWQQPILQAGHP